MYDMIPLFGGGIIFVLGLLMVAMPKQMTKKEMRDDPAVVEKTRKSGMIEIVCGVLIILIRLSRIFLL